jgi:predicted phosphodiesterase
MRLGLIADIHEAVEPLREAIELFRGHGVDEIIHLGDVCRMHDRLDDTIAILHRERIAGVWGNHDYGLCRHVSDEIRRRFSATVIDYMDGMAPALVRDDCRFTHVEPWLDANDLAQLWYFEGLPDTAEKLARCFAAAPQRVLFSGHVHTWFLGGVDGPIAWDGETAVRLAPPRRYVVTLHALVAGYCALYDTATGDLVPYRLKSREPEEV